MRKTENKKGESHEIEINIIPLLKEILKRIWLIVLVGLVLGGSLYIGAKIFVKPQYRSGFTAYVNNRQGKQSTDILSNSDVAASKQIVLTYQKILTSNTILSAAAESIGIDSSYERLRGRVVTEIKDDTEIVSVYVVDTDPQFAYDYAKSIAKTAPQYMAQIVEGSSMKIIDYPEYSDKRFKPSYFTYGVVGFLIGALIVIIFVVIMYFIDDTVKSETEIENKLSIPILGVIPDITKASNSRSDYYYYEKDNATETVSITEGEQNDEKNEEKEQ